MRYEVLDGDRLDLVQRPGSLEIAGWAAAGAALSVLVTGFVFGASNNLFHLPIVAALFDEPQYRDDAFIQSLRYFASGFWLALRGAEKHVDPFWLFLGLHVLSRFVAFLGFLAYASLLGLRSRTDIVIFTMLLSICSLSRGLSYAGGGDLFIDVFTHSEVANGLTLFALYFVARGRVAASFAMNGLVFFVNAFVAVWNAVPFAVIIVDGLRRRELRLSRSLLEAAAGLLLFALLAIPVMLNILANPDFGRPPGFDYIGFLIGYYPEHFLAASIPPLHFFAAMLVVISGFQSFGILGNAARPFKLMLAGYVAVYAIGVVVPLVTHNSTILNLHFSARGHLLPSPGSTWRRRRDDEGVAIGRSHLSPVAGTCTHCRKLYRKQWRPVRAVHFARILGKAWRSVAPGRLGESGPASRAVPLSLAAIAFAYTVSATWIENRWTSTWISEWTATGEWARANTSRTAVFMVPTIDLIANGRNWTPLAEAAQIGSSTFELTSHRRIWVDFRRGAAAMWSASYHDVWRARVNEQIKLGMLDERIDFARRIGVAYVIDLCASDNEARAVHKTARLCVFAVN